MIRKLTAAAALAVIVTGGALAQEAGDAAPAPEAEATHPDVERLRADFNARFVDYDERLADANARVSELEARLAEMERRLQTLLEDGGTPDAGDGEAQEDGSD